ncbi:NAD(P)-binding protein [Mycena filopes]|nr:NAD(P)-binding protein [Mycena filopes]
MVVLLSSISQAWPSRSKFSVNDIPSLSGQVMIVTGGNSGVGKETVKALLQHDAKVYIAARNREKVQAAIDELEEMTGKRAEFLPLDLADLHAVKRGAEEFARYETRLDVLFNNGCVTTQGFDLQFGTNVLGHFYFTTLLLSLLLATAAPGAPARVINTASSAADLFTPPINFNTLKDGPARKKAGTEGLYFQSKFGNVSFSNELARRYGDRGIMSVALNPGNLRTDLQRHLTGIKAFLLDLTLYPVANGALTQLWAATTEAGKTFGGQYLIPWARVGKTLSTDVVAERELWTWLKEQVAGI